MQNGSMLKGYLPEFLAAIFMSGMLLFGYAMRSGMPWPTHFASPRPRVEPRFLLEIENPQGKLRVGTHGEVSGLTVGQLNRTDFVDLRVAAEKLRPSSGKGSWKMRFYDAGGAHEIGFEPASSQPEVQHILDNLRILGFLQVQQANQQGRQGRP